MFKEKSFFQSLFLIDEQISLIVDFSIPAFLFQLLSIYLQLHKQLGRYVGPFSSTE